MMRLQRISASLILSRGLLGRTIGSLTVGSRRWASTADWPPQYAALRRLRHLQLRLSHQRQGEHEPHASASGRGRWRIDSSRHQGGRDSARERSCRGCAVGLSPDTGEPVGPVEVRAPRVLLAAGALGTPRLLWHAGLGEQMNAVGRGLHVHPGSAVFGLCDEEINLWRGATQGAYFHHPDLPGVLPHGFSAPPEVCLMAMDMVGERLEEGLKLLPHLAGMVVMVSDKGEGEVRATPDGRAKVSYDFAEKDIQRIKLGMRETARVLLAGGAREVFTPVHGVGRHTTPESLYAALEPAEITDFTLYASHPMSTCRMGSILHPA